jgi:electron transfer flavoprotein alpha subunit
MVRAASSAARTSTSRTPTSSWPAAAGLGKAEGFEALEALAGAMGGAVAATRAVVDAGWYSYSAADRPDGQDGGAQALSRGGNLRSDPAQGGMQASENIVAINKDSNAPIFEFSISGSSAT